MRESVGNYVVWATFVIFLAVKGMVSVYVVDFVTLTFAFKGSIGICSFRRMLIANFTGGRRCAIGLLFIPAMG